MIRLQEERRGVKAGKCFGRWTVLGSCFTIRYKTVGWAVVCKCDCGTTSIVDLETLVKGKTKSCGCYRSEAGIRDSTTHGLSKHPLYKIWTDIIKRCKHSKHRYYAGRGITVCDEWKNNFKTFYDWAINNDWNRELQIDRINNDGNYEPSNCRFVTCSENSRNRRNNRLITAFGETKTMAAWAEDSRCKATYVALNIRINRRHYDPELAITQPLQHHAK